MKKKMMEHSGKIFVNKLYKLFYSLIRIEKKDFNEAFSRIWIAKMF